MVKKHVITTKTSSLQKLVVWQWLTVISLFLLTASQAACKSPTKPTKEAVRLSPVFRNTFRSPIDMQVYPTQIGQLPPLFAVVEKRGVIYIAAMHQPKTKSERVLLWDHQSQTLSAGWEEGMLSLAFDPAFVTNNRAYVYYSKANPRRTVLSRLTIYQTNTKKVTTLDDLHFSISEEVLLEVRQPFSNHNGGTAVFGPDGMLYLGLGDGGSGGDPRENGQNTNVLLGKILRLDVSPSKGYAIPKDNPFVGKPDHKDEIFAYGMRNPWRMSFLSDGRIIAGDVGQDLYEEITIIRAGENHGWNTMEATHCYKPKVNCNRSGLTLPVLEYSHEEGASVLGGFVYSGKAIPALRGQYIFADSMRGKIWASDLNKKPPVKKLLTTLPGLPSSFAKDSFGELYILEMNGGKIFQLRP